MDFTGGPWLLRNGEKVDIKWYSVTSFTDTNDKLFWDLEGNAFDNGLIGRPNASYDIMESLHNWKYLRGHE